MALGLAMVMCAGDASVRVERLSKTLAEFWPDLPPCRDVDAGEGAITFQIGDSGVMLGKMPAPIPWSELEAPCETSVLWPDAAHEVRRHDSHWLVTVHSEVDPVAMSTLLTKVTAAVLANCPTAIGVFWGSASLIVPKEPFIEMAKEILPEPPALIWVDFRVGPDGDRTSAAFTQGMEALGHMEFETQGAPESPGTLRDRLMSLASYVIENGPVIQNGHTVGQDQDERIRVVYSKSAFGHKGKVMRLVYEEASPTKPWWKFW